MNSATITVTDNTQSPRNLYDLLSTGSGKGYTVVPSAGIFPALTIISTVSYISIQASYKNGSAVVYKGDEKVKNDGTRQGKEMVAGDTDVEQAYPSSASLLDIYLTASANGAVINVEVHNV
jgi:hypothetical protein